MMKSALFLVATLAVLACGAMAYKPVVLWHGMGDTCCNPLSMGRIKREIEKNLEGVYVYSIKVGNSSIEDELAGFIGNANTQIDVVCEQLAADPKLQGGFNAIGFSQGGQFLRAVAERCALPMFNLISMGGQHMGVTDIPHCPIGANQTLCDFMSHLCSLGAYIDGVREVSIQAQYFRSTTSYETYVEKNIFMADINNERPTKNQTYKENLIKLNKLVLVEFTEDTMVEPRESEQFGTWKLGQLTEIVPMRNQSIYTEDWIGLKTLDLAGKLDEKSCKGDHLQFTDQYFHDEVIVPYLSN